ncbi:hypothetical protein HOY81_05960 [Streptomyces sp. JJ36]|nr:hypothetical protein [Streptomyces sp. JJ36]
MLPSLLRLCEPLFRRWWPGSGRHRAASSVRPPCVKPPLPEAERAPARPPRHGAGVVRGEDTVLVRPYLVAHEREEEARLRRARRRALWLAVHGVDVGPRLIHGVEVTA